MDARPGGRVSDLAVSGRFTAAQVQAAVNAGLVTWDVVLGYLRSELEVPEGAVEEWRVGGRDLTTVMVEWLEREAKSA